LEKEGVLPDGMHDARDARRTGCTTHGKEEVILKEEEEERIQRKEGRKERGGGGGDGLNIGIKRTKRVVFIEGKTIPVCA
jgi:hypothetical protein